jgi:hypothetical protein
VSRLWFLAFSVLIFLKGKVLCCAVVGCVCVSMCACIFSCMLAHLFACVCLQPFNFGPFGQFSRNLVRMLKCWSAFQFHTFTFPAVSNGKMWTCVAGTLVPLLSSSVLK